MSGSLTTPFFTALENVSQLMPCQLIIEEVLSCILLTNRNFESFPRQKWHVSNSAHGRKRVPPAHGYFVCAVRQLEVLNYLYWRRHSASGCLLEGRRRKHLQIPFALNSANYLV